MKQFIRSLGLTLARFFIKILPFISLVLFGWLGGGLIHWLGFLGVLNAGWIALVVPILLTFLLWILYNGQDYGSPNEADAREIMIFFALVAFALCLLLILGEVIFFLTKRFDPGWTVACILFTWIFPPTGEVVRAVLNWLVVWFGDMIMVWLEQRHCGIYHRIDDAGYGLFWAKGWRAGLALFVGIHSLKDEIRNNHNYEDVCMPRKTMSFGWMVPPEGIEFITESVQHNPMNSQTIQTVNWFQEKWSSFDGL